MNKFNFYLFTTSICKPPRAVFAPISFCLEYFILARIVPRSLLKFDLINEIHELASGYGNQLKLG